MKNKKLIIVIALIVVILLIVIPRIAKKGTTEKVAGTKQGDNVENYVKEHYLDQELLEYLSGNVTNEKKMAYAIDKINSQAGQIQKEVTKDQLKEKYSEIFGEDLQITEAVFLLSNSYEYEQTRGTFLYKDENEQQPKEQKTAESSDEGQKNVLVITGTEYNKQEDKYIVTIDEKSSEDSDAILIKTSKMELKDNGKGGYSIIDYYRDIKK